MFGETVIESDSDGKFQLAVPSWGVSVFMMGTDASLAPIKVAQAELNAKNLDVPQYFVDRPELNEGEWGTPVPPIGK
jgi:hypothetical protein